MDTSEMDLQEQKSKVKMAIAVRETRIENDSIELKLLKDLLTNLEKEVK